MLKRRLLQSLVGFAAATSALVGLTGTANASPTSFVAKTVHAGGAGSLADEAIGGITWYNRSVTLTNVRFWAHAAECGSMDITAWHAGDPIADQAHYASLCGNATTGKWYTIGDVVLDGSDVVGGINRVMVQVYDDTHHGYGYIVCSREDSACVVYHT